MSEHLANKIIDGCIEGGFFHATCAENKEHGCVVKWSTGAQEQIAAIIANAHQEAPEIMKIPTDRNGKPAVINEMKRQCHGEFFVVRGVECEHCAGAGCDACGLEGGTHEEIEIPWNTIKKIYKAMASASQDA